MPLNLDLLERVRDQILEEPESHRQDNWATVEALFDPPDLIRGLPVVSCLTTACVAGWACTLSGDRMAVLREYVDGRLVYVAQEAADTNGKFHSIGSRARGLLGLSVADASYLFYGARSREEVLDMLDWLILKAEQQELNTAGLEL